MAELDFVTLDLANLAADRERLDERWSGCLLHGFGATAHDLVGLAPLIGGARRWIFPHAPQEITFAGMSYGRAWFPRDSHELEAALTGNYFTALQENEPEGLSRAATEVRALIDREGIPWERLVLGGFSQGAMVSAEILRQGAFDDSLPLPGAVLLFSGSLVGVRRWTPTTVSSRPFPPVFQSHGDGDPVLPFEEGVALREALTGLGYTVNFCTFHGGHEIPPTLGKWANGFIAEALLSEPS